MVAGPQSGQRGSPEEGWDAVDRFFVDLLVAPDPALAAAMAANEAARLPRQDVSPLQGKFLHLLARLCGARNVLEIGTLGGYSAIWLAQALPEGGRVISLEADSRHAEVARANIARAGLARRVEVRVGSALASLPAVEAERLGPFDLIFIDADKANNPHYLAWALKLSHRGTVIVVDNVVREGAVIDASNPAPGIRGTRRMLELMSNEPRLAATAIQTVGSKGHDGFVIAVVTADSPD